MPLAKRRRLPAAPAPLTLAQALRDKLRELLQLKQWPQRTFAKRLGMSQGAVSSLILAKRRADVLDYLEKIANLGFGIPLSDLVRDLEVRVAASQRARVKEPMAIRLIDESDEAPTDVGTVRRELRGVVQQITVLQQRLSELMRQEEELSSPRDVARDDDTPRRVPS